MKKVLFLAAMAFAVTTATFAQDVAKQDAPVATKKAKKAKKAKTATAAATTTVVSATPAAAPAKPVAQANAPVAAEKTASKPSSKAAMKFETDVMDYGTIKQNSERVRKFFFTNTGKEPLVIQSAQGSCGCTVPTYPKEPIMPGQKASIDVNYDTNRVGPFTKTVTLTTNADGQETKVLTIKGTVEASGDAGAAAPAGH